ncbi:hypothetical protein TRICI_002503 [Trichomonascus ciferrii]|uniref:Reverse transcriptase Ty1/copia-type domain-containing protein n=1 Tax=Trichomonascus ciferrii TaxID=44093 RepID=A0A642V7T2_9ASCO|nr:hypothetical protein TRICI_002503 [Trichomonascus ciferrii]
MNSLRDHGVGEYVPRPSDKNVVGNRWMFKLEYDNNGNIAKYNARFVCQGFTQEEGIDYTETFAPVTRYESVRFLLALAAQFECDIHQMDVDTAFLNGELDEEIYMELPKGFGFDKESEKVCRLKKSLYGLKQAPLYWYTVVKKALMDMGFEVNNAENGIYSKRTGGKFVAAGFFVDDLLCIANNAKLLQDTKTLLKKRFKIKDLGSISKFLGVRIKQDPKSKAVTMDHEQYINELLKELDLPEAKISPCPTWNGMNIDDCDNSPLLSDGSQYRSLVGKFLWVAVSMRADTAFEVSHLSRYLSCPRECHWTAAKHVLRYLKGSKSRGLFNTQSNLPLRLLIFGCGFGQ